MTDSPGINLTAHIFISRLQSEFCNQQKLPAKVVRVSNVIDAARQTASRGCCHTGDVRLSLKRKKSGHRLCGISFYCFDTYTYKKTQIHFYILSGTFNAPCGKLTEN